MKKGLLLLIWMLGSMLFGTVDLRTTINPVTVGGADERAGFIVFDMRSDDFANASPGNPVYIALYFDRNARFSETLVDIESSAMGHDPIALPVAISTQSGNVQINVPTDAVSIVRWRQGEGRIWLKVTSSSSTWVNRDGVLGPPSADDRVYFSLGQTFAEAQGQYGQLFNDGLANLVGPTRHGGEEVDADLRLDLTNSNVQPSPHPESLISFDPSSWDGSTTGVNTSPTEAGIQVGLLTFPSYSGDTEVARAMGVPQDRWVYYFSTYRGEFSGDMIFNNRFPEATTMTLRPYDQQGNALADVDVLVEAASLKKVSIVSLFGDLPVTHCQILGSARCVVTVSHGNERTSLTSHVPEGDGGQFYWEYFPEDLALGKDYLVLVNLGNEEATLNVTMVDEQGTPLESVVLFENQPIPAKGRRIISLAKIGNNPGAVAMYRFVGSQKMGVSAWRASKLRGRARCFSPVSIITLEP